MHFYCSRFWCIHMPTKDSHQQINQHRNLQISELLVKQMKIVVLVHIVAVRTNVFLGVFAIMVKNKLLITVITILNAYLDVVQVINAVILRNVCKFVPQIQIVSLSVALSATAPLSNYA